MPLDRKQDIKRLWVSSGGFCAVFHKLITNIKDNKILGEEAHIKVSTNGKPKHRRVDMPANELLTSDNILIVCGGCHDETDELTIEEMQELKAKHETFVHDVLDGHFNPKEFGKGRYFTKGTVYYEPCEIPFNRKKERFNYMFLALALVGIFIITFQFTNQPPNKLILKNQKYIDYFFYGMMCLLFLANLFGFYYNYTRMKKANPTIQHEGNCVMEGCNGVVIVQPNHPDLKHVVPEVGICNADLTHRYSVSYDKTRGNPFTEIQVPIRIPVPTK